ncbi:LysB family phage lysis regulatory protein [Pseudomonas nitroreducens]|nr:LysB family phage lysis regulatory protein [Pseudomonas nitroreducens]MCP1689576.1 LysB family phage lysis regulatory protein [Pseudomonas nitroreducens]
MSTLRQALYSLALLGSLSLLLWGTYQKSQTEQARAALAEDKLQTAQERNDRQAATITRIGAELAQQRAAQEDLQTTLDDLRQARAADHIEKQELKRHDTTLQAWADQPLPDAARRLHQRPAITGADGYRQWLSGRHALQPAAGPATEQRRAE